MSIILIGMRGAGKSTIGRLLAETMNWAFLDLDDVLEEKTRRKINDIVAQDGWEAFRQIELDVLAKSLSSNGQQYVIACGGGLVETGAARDVLKRYMADGGHVVWANRDIREVFSYLRKDETRPALVDDLEEVWSRREPWFRVCSNILVSSSSAHSAVAEILETRQR